MKTIHIYHSPDADDAFMFYGIASGNIISDSLEFKLEHSDIQSLNELAQNQDLECSAASVHAYAYLNDRYAILSSGASLGGRDYGPKLVCRDKNSLNKKTKLTIAIPGKLTSACLALKIWLEENNLEAELIEKYFATIQDCVAAGDVDAGLIIHEGQLKLHEYKLETMVDLGVWWWGRYELPLPLGVNIVSNSLAHQVQGEIQRIVKASIEYGLMNRDAALDYAQGFAKDISREQIDKFVSMYVNDWTVDLREQGKEAIQRFLELGQGYGFVPEHKNILFI